MPQHMPVDRRFIPCLLRAYTVPVPSTLGAGTEYEQKRGEPDGTCGMSPQRKEMQKNGEESEKKREMLADRKIIPTFASVKKQIV